MNKTTKTILGVAIVGVGGYLIWKNMNPKTPTNTNFVGKRMVGMSGKRNLTDVKTDISKDSGWLRAEGYAEGKTDRFFVVNDSGWMN